MTPRLAARLIVVALLTGCSFTIDRTLDAGEIRGRLTWARTDGASAPAAGALVRVPGAGLRLGADADGRFVVRGLPAGHHSLQFQADLDQDGRPDVGLTLDGVDNGDGLDLGTLVLGRLASLDGTVTADGRPIARARVALEGAGETWTDVDGHFAFDALTPTHAGRTLIVGAQQAGAFASAPITLVAGEAKHLELGLAATSGAASITGHASLAGSRDSSGIQVTFENERTRLEAETNAAGLFALTDVPAGVYLARARHEGHSTVTLPVVVVSGELVLPDLALPVANATCGVGSLDTDHDGMGDACDDCPDVADREQRDDDRNGHGDACESGDRVPPSLSAIAPADEATGVSEHVAIALTFTEAMDESTITATTFALATALGPVAAHLATTPTTATLTPDSPLPSSARITVTLAAGLTDLAGNALPAQVTHFTTGDSQPPALVALAPFDGDTLVPENTTVSATFSEPIVAREGALTLDCGGPIAGRLDTSGTTLTFTPDAPLRSSDACALTLAATITDLTGNPFAGLATRFTTGDTRAPERLSTQPASGAIFVSPSSDLLVTFDEPIAPASVPEGTFTLDGLAPSATTVTVEGAVVRLHPIQPFAPGTTWTAHLGADVTDLAGKKVSGAYTWTFTIAPDLGPPGSPDATLNGVGSLTLAGKWDVPHALVIDPQGRLVVVGEGYNDAMAMCMSVWRFLADGTPDATFGTNGVFRITGSAVPSSRYDAGWGVIVDHAGRLVVTGQTNNGSPIYMGLWRLTDDGRLDTTFNGTGKVFVSRTTGNAGYDLGEAVIEDASHRLVVSGFSKATEGAGLVHIDAVVWRFTEDGQLDTTGFNAPLGWAKATATTGAPIDDSSDDARAITLDAQGRLVVAGYSRDAAKATHVVVWRFTADGALDTSFGTNGHFDMTGTGGASGPTASDGARRVVLDSQGRVVVCGTSASATGQLMMATWRLTPAGALDPTFNGTGHFTKLGTAGGTLRDWATGCVVDSADRPVVVGGSTNAAGKYTSAVWRLTTAGTLDPTFAGTGAVTTSGTAGGTGNNAGDLADAVALDALGRIVVAGESRDSAAAMHLGIWRWAP